VTVSAFRAIGLVALLTTQACVIYKRDGARPEVIAPTKVQSIAATTSGRERRSGFGPKSVQGKTPPRRLIAGDGTSCTVSEEKYDSTAIGNSVWCAWFDTDRGGTPAN
jgi:hypothetical protein